jgi:protein-L-isoaspartate(D-aspartate) O-methyltransferase
MDVYPQLVDWARQNIKKADEDLLTSGTVTLQVGDGWQGLPEYAPFHAIHVGAAAETLPIHLMMQLYPNGGIMVIPIGPEGGFQNLYRQVRFEILFSMYETKK